jgi:hypothetical protein
VKRSVAKAPMPPEVVPSPAFRTKGAKTTETRRMLLKGVGAADTARQSSV